MAEKKEEEITLDKNNPDSIYNWVSFKIRNPSFRNIIKDFIDENCNIFLDVDENTFQQGQIFNEFTQLIENLLNDVLIEGGLTQEQFLVAAERGLQDEKYKKYFDQILNFSDYTYFKKLMTKRNYHLIKQIEEQMEKQKIQENNEETKKKEEDKGAGPIQLENQNNNFPKTDKQIEEENHMRLLNQLLYKEEEEDLQKAIQQSIQMEEEKRKIQIIEEEEIRRAIKQSLMESQNKFVDNEKKEEEKPKPKKQVFQIQQKDMFNIETEEKPKTTIIPPTEPKITRPLNVISNNNNFQFSGNLSKKEEKPTNIISASKGFDFQIESRNNDFGITYSTPNQNQNKEQNIFPDITQKPNPYARPSPPEQNNSDLNDKNHIMHQLIDDEAEVKKGGKEYSPTCIEIESKNKKKVEINEEEKPRTIKNEKKQEIVNPVQFEDNSKEENIIVTNEIKREKASDIIKQSLNDNKNINQNEEENDEGGLLIDDEEDANNFQAKTNTFIDKKKDINLGKVRVGKDGGNFQNYYGRMYNYEKDGIKNLENKIKEGEFKSVITQNDDEDYLDKLKEVEDEKKLKLKEYREILLKMKKEKRENRAKEVLSPEEMAKLENKKRLAEQLKAKRK